MWNAGPELDRIRARAGRRSQQGRAAGEAEEDEKEKSRPGHPPHTRPRWGQDNFLVMFSFCSWSGGTTTRGGRGKSGNRARSRVAYDQVLQEAQLTVSSSPVLRPRVCTWRPSGWVCIHSYSDSTACQALHHRRGPRPRGDRPALDWPDTGMYTHVRITPRTSLRRGRPNGSLSREQT